VGPRVGVDDMEKRKFLSTPGLELQPLGRPADSQSLYRLRYSGSHLSSWTEEKTKTGYPISRSEFEPNTFRIQVYSITITPVGLKPVEHRCASSGACRPVTLRNLQTTQQQRCVPSVIGSTSQFASAKC
jgi:hypothetical protein